MERLKHLTGKTAASALSAALLLTALQFPAASAAGVPKLSMNLLGGGSVVGIGYRLEVPDELEDYTVTLDGETVTPDADGCFQSSEYAMNMTKTHTVVVTKRGEEVLSKETSVCSYLNALLDDASYVRYFDVAKAMLLYGGRAQEYFGVDTANLASEGVEMSEVLKYEVPEDEFDKGAFNTALTLAGAPISYTGMNLSLQSEIRFSLFFEFSDSIENSEANAADYLSRAKFGGADAVYERNGSRFYQVSVTVNAKDLEKTLVFKTDDGVEAEFRPSQYLYAALKTLDAPLETLCDTLYNYGKAAENAAYGMGDVLYKWETLPPVTNGRATCYKFQTGHAHLDDYLEEHDLYAAALTDEYYAKYAGAMIEVTYTNENGAKKTIKALAADEMPIADQTNDRHEGDIDLDEAGFKALTGKTLEEGGDFPVEWRIVELEPATRSKIYYHLVEGSSQWYLKIQPRSSLYPLSKFEYMDSNDVYHEVARTTDNCYEIQYTDAAPFDARHMTFRMTDIFGETITEANVDLGISERITADMDVPVGTNAVQFSRDMV